MSRYGMSFPPNNRMWYERPIGTGYALSLAGGTMEGPVYLWREPRYPTEAASKAYVDFAVGNTGGPFLGINGGHMRGPLLLQQDPVSLSEAATRNYVDRTVRNASFGLNSLPLTGGVIFDPHAVPNTNVLTIRAAPGNSAQLEYTVDGAANAYIAGMGPAGHFHIYDIASTPAYRFDIDPAGFVHIAQGLGVGVNSTNTGPGTVNAAGYYLNGSDLVARLVALEQWVETH